MADIPKPSRWHARAGAYVRLPDRSVGRVLNVTKRSKMLKVRVGARHVTISRDLVVLVDTHSAAMLGGEPWTGCCGIPISELHPLDIAILDPLAVTCAGMAGWPGVAPSVGTIVATPPSPQPPQGDTAMSVNDPTDEHHMGRV